MYDATATPYLDAAAIDWATVREAVFDVRQTLRYEYPGPITDLRHRLMLIPPDHYGGQQLLDYSVAVTPPAIARYASDQFGNRLCQVALPRVERLLSFDVRLRVRRRAGAFVAGPPAEHLQWYTIPSPLAEPDAVMRAAAVQLRAEQGDNAALAARINGWTHAQLRYRTGATDFSTTGAEALARGEGVCQDYTHIMLAVCRAAGLPARYVSGHLLGEGAMHAWVEVLLPGDDGAIWQPFDPTNNRAAGLSYITIAAGRDYGDVSPTRGSFTAPYQGWLSEGSKEAGVVSVAA